MQGAARGGAGRRAVFGALAAFILLAPAGPQIFGANAPVLRPWVMFSEVGVGLLKGAFILRSADGGETRLTPLQALGFDGWPRALAVGQPHHVLAPGDLARVAAPVCARLGAGEALAFEGWRAAHDGWRRLDVADICGGGA